jgi:hypothetical protein
LWHHLAKPLFYLVDKLSVCAVSKPSYFIAAQAESNFNSYKLSVMAYFPRFNGVVTLIGESDSVSGKSIEHFQEAI